MKTYRVRWEIDVDADSPEQAACRARDTQRRPESIATVFEVRIAGGARHRWRTVDLLELDWLECGICGEPVLEEDMREHLMCHSGHAAGTEWEEMQLMENLEESGK